MKLPFIRNRITRKPRAKGRDILQSGLVFFGLVVILLAWGLLLFQLGKSKEALLAGLRREQTNLTGLLGENLFQILEQKQIIELFALNWFADHQQKPLDDITGFLYGERTFTRVVLYDLSGESFYQSSPRQDLREDPATIRSLMDQMKSQDPPLRVAGKGDSSEMSWQIPFLFPLNQGNGTKGAMLLELDLGYFLNLLQNINIGRTGKIMICSESGAELARFESGGLAAGDVLPHSITAGMTGFSGTRMVEYPGRGDFLLTSHRVRGYPFIITVGQSLEEFLSGFRQVRARMFSLLFVLSSFCLMGVYFLLGMIDRKNQYLTALALSNAQNSELIQKLEKEHQASSQAASIDSLTQLYNRGMFVSLAQKNLFLAKRNKFSYAILFIDLDRFKKINDTLGHRIGDLLLMGVAQRLRACTRKSDIVGRFGGDEFVVMLTEMSTEHGISPIVEKMIAAISEPYENLDGHQIITSPSIGISVYPRDGEDMETLLRNADAAMYKSKKSGRGRYRFFDPSLNTVSVEKFELEQRMPSAISSGEFVLHYQPKIRLEDFRVVGLEALIRWHHPDHQLIFPSDFIEIAEETGLIVDLGRWTLEAACLQLDSWRSAGLDPVPIAVNVSPIELKDRAYSHQFLETLARFRIPPELVEIEITENAFIEDRNMVVGNLETLFGHGVKISLDDFGTGFSSLDHIRSLPISTLKIDRSFVQEIRNSHHDSPIVSSAIILAQKLHMTVVAEGIETHDQLVNLKVAGCDQVQGYLFSRPIPEKKIREFIVSPIRRL